MKQNFTLGDVISIKGALLMLDDATPHVAVPVQVIRDGEVVATVLSDEQGKYKFINLKSGSYQLRCQVLGGCVYYGEERRGKRENQKAGQRGSKEAGERGDGDILRVESGKTLKDIDFRFAPFKKGIWRNYSYLDGLTNDGILAVYCDPDGVMWFGSHIGVFRYDGKGFVNFTTKDGLGHGHVHPIARDPDGMMWFGTWGGGVSRYDGKEFVTFTTEDGLAHDIVFAIHCDRDGMMWFGTYGGGVSRYDGKTFVNFTTEDGLVSNIVRAIYGEPDGVMWFGTQDGVSRYDGRGMGDCPHFVNFTTEDGLAHNRIGANHSIYCDPNGVIWFGTLGGVSRYGGKEFVNLTKKDGLADDLVYAIHCDPNGVAWFGTRDGVSRYDETGFVNFTTEDGLAHNSVYAIHSDPDGVMWFATRGGGVSRYDPNAFVNFTTKDGLVSNRVNAMHRDPDGVIWFGTDGGVSRYDGKEFVNFTTEDGLPHNIVTAIQSDPDGVMWFGTDGCCVSRYDGKEFVNFSIADGLNHSNVCIHRDPDGVMWFGIGGYTSDWLTVGGVFRYDGKEFVNLTTENALTQNYVNDIHRGPNGIMWFATGATLVVGGLSRYDGKEFVTFTTQDGLAHNNVEVIHRDPDGVLWFGTWDGVSRHDGRDMGNSPHFVNFTTEDGLVGNIVFAIHREPDGLMWFGTSSGVSGYDGVAWTSLDARDGLSGRYVRSILQDPDGSLWFGTEGGVTRYRRSITPPRAYIVSVITDQIYHDISDIPVFTPGTRVTIEYDSIDLKTLPEKRQYRCRVYKAGGNESDPSPPYLPPTRNTTFDWTPEEPGTYVFEVQAIDRDLNYSEPSSVELIVQPDPVLVSMKTELSYLRSEVRSKYHFENIIGRSTGVREVRALMERAIDSGLTVLITGETGTGKELVAKAIHHNSPRRDQPILALNCGAVPKELITSSLFGHRKGAFTSAHEDQVGLFEAASGGTVLLDEIGEMPRDAQIQLLRVLEERVVQRIGEHASREVDVRIMAMTNRDLMNEVTEGRFREDLYYRLSVFPIHIPPLRERVEDIPSLAEHFLHEYSQEQKKDLDGFAPDILQMLQSYDWPGNVRELRNVIQRAAALAQEGDRIQTHHLPPQITRGEPVIQEILSEQMNLSTAVDHVQRRLVENALRECNGNRAQAARVLGLHRSNLVRLMKRLGIE